MEADLHNLYPALPVTNQARSNHSLGIIPGEDWLFEDCDFEVNNDQRIAEPRRSARVNIARAFFCMFWDYGLPSSTELRSRLLDWHRADQPNLTEKRRNETIAIIQSTRDPFSDAPDAAEELTFRGGS